MITSFLSLLIYSGKLDLNKPLVLGVSGGPDSVCLLDVCAKMKFPIIVCHVNHHLRKEADEEEKIVEQLVREYRQKFVTTSLPFQTSDMLKKKSIEETSRNYRYKFLFSEAQKAHAQAVLTAHNADDQVETFLMHLIRGSGVSGLAGMKQYWLPNEWDRNIPLIRPLLTVPKEEIMEYCENSNLTFVLDQSNFDPNFFRNRIRNVLIPLMETYNPNLKSLTLQTIAQISDENYLMEKLTREKLAEINYTQAEFMIKFDLDRFLSTHISLQRRIIKYCLLQLKPGKMEINYQVVCRAIDHITRAKSNKRVDLVHDVQLRTEDYKVIMYSKGHEAPTKRYPQLRCEEITLHGERIVTIDEHFDLEVELISNSTEIRFNLSDQDQVFLAEEKIHGPLYLRVAKVGERFSPLGKTNFHIKISDLLSNNKIPSYVRAHYPVLCDQKGILWIPGLRMAERGRVEQSTTRAYHLYLKRK